MDAHENSVVGKKDTNANTTAKEALGVLALLRLAGPLEEAVVHGAHVDVRDVDLGRRRDDIRGSNAAQRHTVVLVRARDEQQAAVKALQEHRAAASKAARKDDDNGARHKRVAQLPQLRRLLLARKLARRTLALLHTVDAHGE